MRNYDETKCVNAINRKPSVQVTLADKLIEVVKESPDVGNSTWGKIDYLCNYCGYRYIMVSKLINKKLYNTYKEDNYEIKSKREKRLNMAQMTKNAMKKAKNY